MLARASFLLFRDTVRVRLLERFSGERDVHIRGLSAGRYEMEDWRRESERLRGGDEACLSKEWWEDSADNGDVTRDVVRRCCGSCAMAATTIGSKGGRCFLGDMRGKREPRCAPTRCQGLGPRTRF